MSPSLFLPRMQAALGKRIRQTSKRFYQVARWRGLERPTVVFIVGCQRSGTTLMTRLFDADRDCRVFGEFSVLSSGDRESGIRLNPLPDVAAIINRVPAPLVVAKPLVETQNVLTLLGYFSGSKALFMYRRYTDVARSDLAKFGARNAIENLRPIAGGDRNNWRSTGASETVRTIIARHFAEDMSAADAAALFWFARNRLFFDLQLADRTDVLLCRYEHLAAQPESVMRRIYDFVNLPCPDLTHLSQVHSSSVRKGSELQLSAGVRQVCEELQSRLDEQYALALNQTPAEPLARGAVA